MDLEGYCEIPSKEIPNFNFEDHSICGHTLQNVDKVVVISNNERSIVRN